MFTSENLPFELLKFGIDMLKIFGSKILKFRFWPNLYFAS